MGDPQSSLYHPSGFPCAFSHYSPLSGYPSHLCIMSPAFFFPFTIFQKLIPCRVRCSNNIFLSFERAKQGCRKPPREWEMFLEWESHHFCDDGNILLCTIQSSSHEPPVTIEPLKCGHCNWETEFLILFPFNLSLIATCGSWLLYWTMQDNTVTPQFKNLDTSLYLF